MTKVAIDYELWNREISHKEIQTRIPNQYPSLDTQTFGKLFLYFNGQLVQNPYSKEDYLDFTDTLWLLFLFSDMLDLLKHGISTQRKEIPFRDNPLYLSFLRDSDMIEISFNMGIADTGNGRKIISTLVDERELVDVIITVSKKLRNEIIQTNPLLIEDRSIIKLNDLIIECCKRYNLKIAD